MSTEEMQIADAGKEVHKDEALTNLHQFIDEGIAKEELSEA
ncbi:MAG: hypothetical protein U5L09_11445 [Bacteroidales bacterium]|nr:hypothetical protein [Bacteroidales bacterium]